MSTSPTRAALYLRVSLDATGERLAISRQREACRRIAEDRGWTIVAEYVDNSISASDARKTRPGYDALVRAHDACEFDAILCWDLDRLTRQPRQLEDWVDAAEKSGLLLVTANGEADLTTDGGRMFARVKLAVARGEVERKSARQRAAAAQRAALGRPPLGVRLTGFTPKGDVVPEEAAIVRRIFAAFDAGDSLKSIAVALNDDHVNTRHGRPWNPSSIRTILRNGRYAGRAVYQGAPTGQRGAWEALVDDDLFDAVQARLTDPRRATNRVGTERRHLGSGLYLCDVCERPCSSWSNGRYRCRQGAHVNRSQAPVDEYVRRVIAARLSRPDVADLLAAPKADARPLLDEVGRLRRRLEQIGQDYDAGLVDGARFATATGKVRAELQTAEARLAAVRGPAGALAGVAAAPDPAQAFLAAPLMRQRAIIDALSVVRLAKGTRYSKVFDPATVKIIPR